jgi:hypothetical protein
MSGDPRLVPTGAGGAARQGPTLRRQRGPGRRTALRRGPPHRRALDEIGGDDVQLDVPRLRPAGDAGDSGSAQQHLDHAVTNAENVAKDQLGLHPRAP